MATPFNMSAVARSRSPCSSDTGLAMNWKTLASDINAARSLTGTPRRLKASFQSQTAVNLEHKSPTPECQSDSGAPWQTARSTTTASGRPVGNDRRLLSKVKLACGEQKPSLEREVGAAK